MSTIDIADPRALAIKVAQVALPLIGRKRPDMLNPCYNPWGYEGQLLQLVQMVRAQLEYEGFEYLGNGAFSVAYAHVDHPGRVLKIAISSDSAAAEWWAHCAAYPGPHKPEVFAVGKLGNDSLASRVDFVWMKRYNSGEEQDRYTISDAYNTGIYDDMPTRLKDQMAGIINVMREAGEFGSEDLHSGNLMYDPGNDQWIVMDPVY